MSTRAPGYHLNGKRDEIGLVPAVAELVDEPVGEDLRPAPRERHLGPKDGDSHGDLESDPEWVDR